MTAFSSKSVPTLEMEGRPELADDPEAVSLSTGPSSSMAKEYYEYIPVTNRWGYYKVGSCKEYSLLFGSAMVVQMIISRKFRWQQQVTWMKWVFHILTFWLALPSQYMSVIVTLFLLVQNKLKWQPISSRKNTYEMFNLIYKSIKQENLWPYKTIQEQYKIKQNDTYGLQIGSRGTVPKFISVIWKQLKSEKKVLFEI